MDIVQQIERAEIAALNKEIPEFRQGDTLRVHVRVVEGGKERIQVFEGICIGRSHGGLRSTFTVRKISSGIGVERVFPLYAPIVKKIEVVRRGKVRRAKLYYLRKRVGKKATKVGELKLTGKKADAARRAVAERTAAASGGDAGGKQAAERSSGE